MRTEDNRIPRIGTPKTGPPIFGISHIWVLEGSGVGLGVPALGVTREALCIDPQSVSCDLRSIFLVSPRDVDFVEELRRAHNVVPV